MGGHLKPTACSRAERYFPLLRGTASPRSSTRGLIRMVRRPRYRGHSFDQYLSRRVADARTFELLTSEIGKELQLIKRKGAEAFEAGDYKRVEELKEMAQWVTGFIGQVQALSGKWEEMSRRENLAWEMVPPSDEVKSAQANNISQVPTSSEETREASASNGHSKTEGKSNGKGKGKSKGKGKGFPRSEYVFHILEILEQAGGAAKVKSVLATLERRIGHLLNDYDWEPLKSHPTEPRWQNSAKWCRKNMIGKGWLADNSPNGVWELTELGRAELERLRRERDNT